ncbi:MAG: PAS domain-containing protein [Flavobacteriales bacterium]|nr:PAS domain-containing protein [Flavobacteriales bacterium]
MASSPFPEALNITAELHERPAPAEDPARNQALLQALLESLDGSSAGVLQAMVDGAAAMGSEQGLCTAGISLLEKGPEGEQHMRLAASSGTQPTSPGLSLLKADSPSGFCLSHEGLVLLTGSEQYLDQIKLTAGPITELMAIDFGKGTPEQGVLWLASHDGKYLHAGDGERLRLLAAQGGRAYRSVLERERLAAGKGVISDEHTLLDRLPVGVAKLDREYRYTYLNDRAVASLKTTQDHLLGRAVWDVYPEVAGTFVEDAYRYTMEQRGVKRLELFFTPVGTWFDVESHPAEDGGIVVFFFDAEERKRNETVLFDALGTAERERRFYDTILTTTPDFAYIWSADYTFLYANKALLDLYGLTSEEYVGKSFRDVGYPEWHARMHEREVDEVVRTGKPLRGKIPFQSKGGGGIYDYIFMPVFGPDGQVEAIAGTTRDVTALENAAEALKEADRRKDEFLAVLAHELRNPLAPLRSGVELLAAGVTPYEVQQAREIMARQIDQMVHLVDDLMDLSRVNRGAIELKRDALRLRTVLEAALETVRPLIEAAGQTLHVEFHPIPIMVFGDPTRLAQIFTNLLNNATKYTVNGGRITVRSTVSHGRSVVTVSDTGVGIPKEDQTKVFQMFTQVDRRTDRQKGGLGIGLNVVQRLVQMHEGTISVSSEGSGKGSTFEVMLPLADEQNPIDRNYVKPPEAGRPLRVMVVDDNVDAAFVLSMLLKHMHHEVHATHGGEEALDQVESFHPDVVFLDIGMPGMDGYEVCRRIRQLPGGEKLHLVALTGWGQEEDKELAKQVGFDKHLVKPTDRDTLQRVLAEFASTKR